MSELTKKDIEVLDVIAKENGHKYWKDCAIYKEYCGIPREGINLIERAAVLARQKVETERDENYVCIDFLFPQQFHKLGSHKSRKRIVDAINLHKEQVKRKRKQ